ncbi:hypothetical protein [Cellulomonas sp. ES6]|uniref:hypothetical protein n=1 Tax=Cellulomonas sp. ES6 TaxID=3039384 RepID=UPI0024B867CF|nr:hypothetical protein [Cellulomonas sp. ES6]WHP18805.1 hypothetical protein P9841_06730 [Cellulomonas sp. ES6]
MKMKAHAVVLAVASMVALVASGCGSSSDEKLAETTAAPAPIETTEPAPTPDADAACAVIGDGGSESIVQRIPTALTSIGATIGQEQIDELLDINEKLGDAIELAPTDLAAALTSLKVPFQQAQDAMDSGSGSLSMDTASVAADVTEVLELCVAAGYSVAEADSEAASDAAGVEAALASWSTVSAVTETEPGRFEIQTSIVDPRGDDGSPEAQEAIAICQAAVDAGATYVAVFEADGTHFVLYGHPSAPPGACGEV